MVRKSRKYDSDVTRKRVASDHQFTTRCIGAGTLFYLAKQADPNWREDVQRNDPVRQRIAKLARLDDLDLARVRRDEAKALGIRTDDLDKAVEQARKRQVQRAEPVVPDIDTLATASRPLIDCEDVLTAFVDEFRKVIAGESALAKVLYLSATSRLFDDAMHAVIKGPSSGGKSQVRGRVLEFIPPEDVISFTALSEKALLYMPEDLAHKILSMGEAQDNEQVKFQDYLMRELMSEGKLRYSVVQKRDGELVTIMVEKQGPVAFMVTTTKNKLNAENETRMLSLEVDDSAAQTKAVLRKVAEVEGRNMRGHTIDYALWHNFQRWLAAGSGASLSPSHVLSRTYSNPSRCACGATSRNCSGRSRRMPCSIARHRKYTEEGEIKATIKQDYAGVYPLMRDLLAEASEIKVRKTIAETVAALDAIAATGRRRNDDLGIPVRMIAEKLRLDTSPTYRRLRAAEDAGVVINLEERPRRPGRYQLTGLNRRSRSRYSRRPSSCCRRSDNKSHGVKRKRTTSASRRRHGTAKNGQTHLLRGAVRAREDEDNQDTGGCVGAKARRGLGRRATRKHLWSELIAWTKTSHDRIEAAP